jgi:hypothetical protein
VGIRIEREEDRLVDNEQGMVIGCGEEAPEEVGTLWVHPPGPGFPCFSRCKTILVVGEVLSSYPSRGVRLQVCLVNLNLGWDSSNQLGVSSM